MYEPKKRRKIIKAKAMRAWDHLIPNIVQIPLCMCICICFCNLIVLLISNKLCVHKCKWVPRDWGCRVDLEGLALSSFRMLEVSKGALGCHFYFLFYFLDILWFYLDLCLMQKHLTWVFWAFQGLFERFAGIYTLTA